MSRAAGLHGSSGHSGYSMTVLNHLSSADVLEFLMTGKPTKSNLHTFLQVILQATNTIKSWQLKQKKQSSNYKVERGKQQKD